MNDHKRGILIVLDFSVLLQNVDKSTMPIEAVQIQVEEPQ